MKRLAAVVGLFLALVLGGVVIAADPTSPTLARIVENKEVRVGTSGSQAPFVMKGKDGKLIGFEVDVANALAAAMGVKLKLVQKPFADLLPALERGEVDMVMSGMTITPERSLKFNFAGPYYVSGKSVLTKSPQLTQATLSSEFNKEGLKLVAMTGSTSESFIKDGLPKATFVSAPDYEAAVSMVQSGKADAMVGDLPALVVTMVRNPELGLTATGALLTMEPIGMALPAGDAQLMTLMTSLLTAMETTGKLEERQDYWFKGANWLSRMP